jgi:hypothetical protein
VVLPAPAPPPDEASRRRALIAGFRFYNPFTIGVLGIVVITGAMRLTDLKASMKFEYFARIGEPLALKLGLAFLLIFLQTYITFGLAFRIGRQEEVAAHGDGESFSVEQIDSMLRRIRVMCWTTIILAAAVILVSLTIVRRAIDYTATASNRAALLKCGDAERTVVLDERQQRAHDVSDRDEAENRDRQFVEHVVVHQACGFALGRRERGLIQPCKSCFVGGSVHFTVLSLR